LKSVQVRAMLVAAAVGAACGRAAAEGPNQPAVPGEVRLWNANPLEQLLDRRFDGPAPALQARGVVPRGGTGSGQVVVTDGRGLGGLTAVLSSLRSAEGAAIFDLAGEAARAAGKP